MTKLTRPLSRSTVKKLDRSFGTPDANRPLVVTLIPGTTEDDGTGRPDMIEFRPLGTRRPEHLTVIDGYRYAMRCRLNRLHLEKASRTKAAKAARNLARRIKAAEKRLTRP